MMRRIASIAVALLLLAPWISAEPLPRPDIRPDHPRIFFNSDTWPEVKELAYGQRKADLESLIEEVNRYTDNPVAEGTGPVEVKDRSLPLGDIVEFGREAAACALVWRFTGKDKYLQKAKKMLKVSVDAYTEATKNGRPVRWYAHSRVNACCAYDWIYEALTDEERREIILPLVQHVELVQPYSGLDIPRNNTGAISSGFYGVQSLLWFSGLAGYGDGYCDSLALKHLDKGYELFSEVLQYRCDTAGDDGALATVCPSYSLGHYTYAQFNFIYTMISATGVNIAPRYPELALFPNWIWWLWIRDRPNPPSIRHPGTGDSYHNQNLVSSTRIYEQLSEFLQFYRDSADPDCVGITEALRDRGNGQAIKTNVYPILPFIIKPGPPARDFYKGILENAPLKARHFETLGQIYMRSAWAPDATYCSFTAGSSLANHKHFDENNFTIFKYDHLALDSGDRAGETDYNLCYYYSQSVAHNVVLIHKPGEPLPQHWGIKIQDDPVANENYGGMVNMTGSVVKAFETGDRFTYVASDATFCYGEKATEAVRQFVFVYPDYFIVYDRVGASDPSYRKEWLLHFKNKPVVKKNLTRADCGDGRLFCQTFLPEDAAFSLEGGKGREYWVRDCNYPLAPKYEKEYAEDAARRGRGPYTGAWRLEIKPGEERSDDRFLNVLTAAYVDRTKPVDARYFRENGQDCVALKTEDGRITFRFNIDGEIGGTVEYDGVSRPLTGEVQKQKGFIYE